MPEMDGYETMRAIRKIPAIPRAADHRFNSQGDEGRPSAKMRIEAGASDYVTKPVDLEQLFSVLRVWMNSENEVVQTAVHV